MPLSEYDSFTFTAPVAKGIRHRVLFRGTGPAVIVLHEIFGLAQECIALGDRLAQDPAGSFAVYMPVLFGQPGERSGVMKACINREFHCLAANRTSPIADWLRALAVEVRARSGSRSVGAVGMCLTGGFVLSMMIEPAVAAAVACQPSLPLTGATKVGFNKRALGISPSDLAAARRRHLDGAALMAIRFETDNICPRERIDRLQEEFPNIRRIELPAEDRKHASLTEHFDARAYRELTQFLSTHLR